jgi:glycosyltransferase involved in cell wall biosynthesis
MNVAGYFKGVMGVGEHARQLAAALRTQGIAVTTFTLHPEASPEDDALTSDADSGADDRGRADFNLICANADSVPSVAELLGPEFFADRYTVGFWAWEVSAFPDRFLDAFGYLDEVWVGSRHVRDAVAAKATVPVLAIPQPVSLPDASGDAVAPAGLPGGFRFLFAFDYLSVFERKNPLATIEAFTRAFPPGSGASLIVKSLNDAHDPESHRRLRAAAAAHPDVHLIERRLSSAERNGLMNAADCYVSLHRAEGFGYTLAEAMWLGKPVIATGYSGNVDYMSPANSYLVDHRLVPIGPGHEPYPADGVWAAPDVDHAARLMREVFEHPDEARRRGALAATDIRASHGPQAAGHVMASRLDALMASPSLLRERRRIRRSAAVYTNRAAERIRSGPEQDNARGSAARQAARRALLRALRPVTAYQRQVNEDILRAIEVVDESAQSVARDQADGARRIEELEAQLRTPRDRQD